MESENPYQSPAEVTLVEAPADSEFVQLASSPRRLVNMLLDFVGCLTLLFVVCLIIGGAGEVVGMRSFLAYVPFLAVEIPVTLFYYIVQETLWGKTFGKLVTRTKVISADGEALTLKQIIGRTLCRMIPFEQFSYILGGYYPIGLHDRLSGTLVISDRAPSIPNPQSLTSAL